MRSLIYRSRHMARWLWHDMRCLWVFVMVLWLEWLSNHEVCVALPFWHVLFMFRTLLMRGKFFTKLPKSILALSNGCETWWSCSWDRYEAIEYLTCSLDMCSILCWFLSMREALGCIFLHFWLDSCIANKGEKFELEMAYWMHLEGFQVVLSHFWALLHTGLTGQGHRFDRSECWPCSYVGHRSDRW
jgi:hypothetical protein